MSGRVGDRSKVFQQSSCLSLVSDDQAQVLDTIQRFRIILDDPFPERGTVRRGGRRQ